MLLHYYFSQQLYTAHSLLDVYIYTTPAPALSSLQQQRRPETNITESRAIYSPLLAGWLAGVVDIRKKRKTNYAPRTARRSCLSSAYTCCVCVCVCILWHSSALNLEKSIVRQAIEKIKLKKKNTQLILLSEENAIFLTFKYFF